MKATGIITEYNPLHNGHIYHIEQSKVLTNPDCLIAVMSGNFVQRGEPAIIDKYRRAQAAIDSGVNLVVELPAMYALSSAEGFAAGGIKILNTLNAECLVFGSECGDLHALSRVAELLADEPEEFKNILIKELAAGTVFPAARQKAIEKILGDSFTDTDNSSMSVLSDPNNILGIEYIKSILRTNSRIIPFTLKRMGNGYNDRILHDTCSINSENLPSASAIRNYLAAESDGQSHNNWDFLNASVPTSMAELLKDSYIQSGGQIMIDDFTILFNTTMNKIIRDCHWNKAEIIQQLSAYIDINEDLAARMYKCFKGTEPISDFCKNVKNKQYTYSRISRAVLHIILGMTKERFKPYAKNQVPYIRILGFDEAGAKYLSSIRNTCNVPIITKVSDYATLLQDDLYCSHIYNEVVFNKCGYLLKDEYRTGVYIKK